MNALLVPHLLDLLEETDSQDLILAGGFGLFLKDEFVRREKLQVLIPGFSQTRTTQDLDFFLAMSLFAPEKASAFTEVLARLGYEVLESAKHFHFAKTIPQPPLPPLSIRIDLLARVPREDEDIKFDSRRVRAPSGIHLHGRTTPEAFSVESRAQALPLSGQKTSGESVSTRVLVPHPYSWINLKVQAAYDWLQREQGGQAAKPGSLKHLQDIYTLVALLTQAELAEAREMAVEYGHLDAAQTVRTGCEALFGQDDSRGLVELERLIGQPVNAAFLPALRQALGV